MNWYELFNEYCTVYNENIYDNGEINNEYDFMDESNLKLCLNNDTIIYVENAVCVQHSTDDSSVPNHYIFIKSNDGYETFLEFHGDTAFDDVDITLF